MWKSTVLRGLFFSKVVWISYLLNVWARNSGDWPEAGTSWELVVINLNVHFFLWVRELFCIEWWGGPRGEF